MNKLEKSPDFIKLYSAEESDKVREAALLLTQGTLQGLSDGLRPQMPWVLPSRQRVGQCKAPGLGTVIRTGTEGGVRRCEWRGSGKITDEDERGGTGWGRACRVSPW